MEIRCSAREIERELLGQVDKAAERLLFLSEASRILSSALTDIECFDRLLQLIVPRFADWSTLTVIDDQGELHRVGIAHSNPEKQKILKTLVDHYPPQLNDLIGPGFSIHSKESEFHPEFGMALEEQLRKQHHTEVADVARLLGMRSLISVPIIAYGRILGALSMVTSDSGRVFTLEDLRLAEEIAARAAYPAFHLIQYAKTSKKIEQMKAEIDLQERFLLRLRHDVRSSLSAAILAAQLLEQSESTRKDELARKVIDSIQRVTEILDRTKGQYHRVMQMEEDGAIVSL